MTIYPNALPTYEVTFTPFTEVITMEGLDEAEERARKFLGTWEEQTDKLERKERAQSVNRTQHITNWA